ncbi:DNA-binding protein WhiA [Acholeplasma vituli]|uniref:Probable cell division protein WhiA n=1 Tax=Paracholeplasma vituli TaxID=69473 RepID=A0ABT2PWL2_9MOLU|nr:DNA-binding protein WhiA [Paracholeplasma vituli]MCU0105345.1 DNA-binding protein WhiA [Paracholeplasma vituli]
MSFARTVKDEIVKIRTDAKAQLAELSALLHLNTDIHLTSEGVHLEFHTNNPSIARRFFVLIKNMYEAKTEIISKKTMKLNKKSGYLVLVKSHVNKIMDEHSMVDQNVMEYEFLTETDEEKKAYLRGAFLATGSVNDPIKPTYHLELFVMNKTDAIFIQRLMNHFDLNAKITKRRQGLIVYLKESEAISAFLSAIGAFEAVFKFEDERIKRDFNNSINRLINIEIANEKKTIEAANDQLEDIELIKANKALGTIDSKLKDTIRLREAYPEASLSELIEKYEEETGQKISKSGMNHRLMKIKALAEFIREGKK